MTTSTRRTNKDSLEDVVGVHRVGGGGIGKVVIVVVVIGTLMYRPPNLAMTATVNLALQAPLWVHKLGMRVTSSTRLWTWLPVNLNWDVTALIRV